MNRLVRLCVAGAMLLMSLQLHASDATASSWWRTPDQRGAELLESGDAATASEVFSDARWRGISHYRNGNFTEAQKEFANSADSESLYNQGTAAAKAGDYQTALQRLQELTQADPNHQDALHNLEIVKKLLDNQQQSSDQQQDSDGEKSDQDQSDKSESEQGESDGDQQQSAEQQSEDGKGGGNDEQQASADSNQNSKGNDNQNGNSENSGELSADAQDARENQDAQQNQSPQQKQSPQQNQEPQGSEGTPENEGSQENQSPEKNPTESESEADARSNIGQPPQTPAMSETEQATEQWMRRIPDDPSQLLRNKIKLNHMIEHENVTDLPDPW